MTPSPIPPLESSRSRFQTILRDARQLPSQPAQPVKEKSASSEDEKGENSPPVVSRAQAKKRFLSWLRPYRGRVVLLMAMTIFTSSINLLQPVVSRHLIDHVVLNPRFASSEKQRLIVLIGLGMLAALFVSFTVEVLRATNTQRVNFFLVDRIRRQLYQRLLRLPLPDLSRLKIGGISSLLNHDSEALSGLAQRVVLLPLEALLRVFGTLSIIFALNWRLALVSLIVIPPMLLISSFFVGRLRSFYGKIHEIESMNNARSTEVFGGIRVVRSARREKFEERQFCSHLHTQIRTRLYVVFRQCLVDVGWSMLITTGTFCIIAVGGYFVVAGRSTLGDVVALALYTALILEPIFIYVNSQSLAQQSYAALDRICQIMELAPDKPDRPGAHNVPRTVKTIELRGVDFAYKDNCFVLQNINLNIPGGTSVAFVGRSGAGKSTLTDLIGRFHDPSGGKILLNGIDLQDYRIESYRQRVGIVGQDVILFDGTIAENIAYCRPNATITEIVSAAERACCHEFIDSLEKGYSTRIGERGMRLSGGQRQRLSIARTFLMDPAILILDEATSHLDSESEEVIQSSLEELLADRTTFIVAHRLSTVRSADQIVFLEDGRVVEIGTHDELLSRSGRYAQLFRKQTDRVYV